MKKKKEGIKTMEDVIVTFKQPDRGFMLVEEASKLAKLPVRATKGSAGYDLFLKENIVLYPGKMVLTFTDVKAFMNEDEVLELHIRSSVGVKKNVMLANATGIIDSTYFENESNDGNIGLPLYNYGNKVVTFNAGDRIAQCIFKKYLTTGDIPTEERKGGFGSTGKGE